MSGFKKSAIGFEKKTKWQYVLVRDQDTLELQSGSRGDDCVSVEDMREFRTHSTISAPAGRDEVGDSTQRTLTPIEEHGDD